MKITKHGRYLYKLTKYWLFNCYLLEDGDGLILIDASLPGQGEAILKAADEIGKPIQKIVITHGHTDHVGSINEIVASQPAIKFFAYQRYVPLMSGDFSLRPGEGDQALNPQRFPTIEAPLAGSINEGEQVGPLVAYASPGHTVAHVSWYDPRDGTLITGDAWQTAGGVAVMGDTRWLFPFPSLITTRKYTAVQSAKTLLALKPNRLATGHGNVLEHPSEAMQKALARAERKFG